MRWIGWGMGWVRREGGVVVVVVGWSVGVVGMGMGMGK